MSEQGHKCENCRFFEHTGRTREEGECRFDPPQALVQVVSENSVINSAWPTVAASDWCGKFQQ
jgi:hypothetical protein